MKGTLHFVAGVTTGVCTGITLFPNDPLSAVLFTASCTLGSILPDIDSPKSMISKCIPIIPTIVNKIFGHRNLLHAPILPALCSLFLYLFKEELTEIAWVCGYGILAGYVLHLLQDAFTIRGIPIFYPFSQYKLHFSNARSGSFWNYPTTATIVALWIFICVNGSHSTEIACKMIIQICGRFV